MFGRLLWQLLRGNRGRLAVALVAIISGAAAVSALLNMEFDVRRKFEQEFRGLGANLIVSAQVSPGSAERPLLDASAVEAAVSAQAPAGTIAAPFLYVVAHGGAGTGRPVVLAGTSLNVASELSPWWGLQSASIPARNVSAGNVSARDIKDRCMAGAKAAKLFNLAAGSELRLSYGANEMTCTVTQVINAGSEEDTQIFADLDAVQALAGLNNKIEVMKLRVPSSPGAVTLMTRLNAQFAAAGIGMRVSAIREIPATEGALLNRIKLLVFSMSALLLILTAICVLGTMAALAAERRNDVGLMKALGGSIQRIVALFLAELAVLGITGAILGYIAGMGLTLWIGEKVFGARISPRPEVFFITIAMMLLVALVGVLPLRPLGRVKPAVILRGE